MALMDTALWKDGDEFSVLDLVAKFEFRTASSLSFLLGKLGIPKLDNEPLQSLLKPGLMFIVDGWLDIHYPCIGVHRLQIRVGLPDRYVSWESMRDLVPQVIAALNLPTDVSYRVFLEGL